MESLVGQQEAKIDAPRPAKMSRRPFNSIAQADPTEGYFAQGKLLDGYCEIVGDLGGDPEGWLEAAGINTALLQDPDVRVPLRVVGRLLEESAARLGCPDLGMRLAERQSMETAMQPLDRLFCAAPNIRVAFQCGIDHINAFNSGLIMELEESTDDWSLLHFQLLDGLSLFPQLIEQLVLLAHNSILFLSAGFARSRTIWFSHLNKAPPVSYARRFNSVVKFGQEYDGLFISKADLDARVADCNADRFAQEARIVEDEFPTCRKAIDLEVRQAVFRLLTSCEDCTRERIAHLLGLQERTLNRRLSRMGTSFDAIRDEVRQSLAYRYLARQDLSLTEIAGRLGYSELAVLSRSCKRWFGKPPRRLRQDIVAGREAPAFS